MTSRVMLVGWDAADWQIINPLLDQGEMPNLLKLVDEGCIGNLATLYPCLSPLLWTTIATGRTADHHGILSFLEPSPSGTDVQTIRSTSRRTKAIWNIASQSGLRSIVCNWYASYPAESINGITISNETFRSPVCGDYGQWRFPSDAIHPPDLGPMLAELRLHPGELSPADLSELIPSILDIDLQHDQRPAWLAEILARNISVHSLFTASLENEPWDFAAVFYDAIDTAGHIFMPYHPPKMPHISANDFLHYQQVMTELYKLHDKMLGKLMALAGPDTHVLLVSDHGFYSGSDRPHSISQTLNPEAEAAEWHRKYGIFAIRGPNIKKDSRVYGATLLDVAPTILSLLGLTASKEMPGAILADAFVSTPISSRISSWEAIAGNHGQDISLVKDSFAASKEEISTLVKLGYLPESAECRADLVSLVKQERDFNLASVYLNHGHPKDALPILELLLKKAPNEPRFLQSLATAWLNLGNARNCINYVETLNRLGHQSANLYLLAAAAHGQLGNDEFAEDSFQSARSLDPESPLIPLAWGEFLIERGRTDEALIQLEASIEKDEDNPRTWETLAKVRLQKKQAQLAEFAARQAIGRRYFSPVSHYYLGVALAEQDRNQEAVLALQTAIKQAPSMLAARHQLGELYSRISANMASGGISGPIPREKANHSHVTLRPDSYQSTRSSQAGVTKEFSTQNSQVDPSATYARNKETITVVTGLPRSGTSLAMQLLSAAGCELVIDNQRPADEHNPCGYYEFAPVLNLQKDSSFLRLAHGKVIKVNYPLVLELPTEFAYHIIVMERSIEEVLDSQFAMLAKQGMKSALFTASDRSELAASRSATAETAWNILENKANCTVCRISHHKLLNHDSSEFRKLLVFAGASCAPEQLISVVNRQLYRRRRS